ncbi:MAG: hypothetical protein IT373_16335 [Polyangiaceae bacterium]|nr:hypothetical protein [Polyangiaceae bacterium]
MTRRWAGLALVIGAVTGGSAGYSDDAHACGHEMRRQVDRTVIDLEVAENAVSGAAPAVALPVLLLHYPALKSLVPGTFPMADRALRVLGRAIVRTGGGQGLGAAWPSATETERLHNLRWAEHLFRGYALGAPTDPGITTDLAEVLAALPGREKRAEAGRILGVLEARDLITSAHGYATLARLHRAVGEGKPTWQRHVLDALAFGPLRVAEARCDKMATGNPAICRAAPQPAERPASSPPLAVAGPPSRGS